MIKLIFTFFLTLITWGECLKGNDPREVTFWDTGCKRLIYSPPSGTSKSSFLSERAPDTCPSFQESRTLVEWGLTLPPEAEGKTCNEGDKCLDFGVAKVVVVYDGFCEKVHWTSTQLKELKDCLYLFGHWYGGGEQYNEPWPVEKIPWVETPFMVSDKLNTHGGVFGSVSESYWVSSDGIAARVDETVPLFLSLPDSDSDGRADKMCFSSKYQHPFAAESPDSPLNLTYYLCYADDVRKVYELSYPIFFAYPKGVPDDRMITHPIWSTWAQFFKDVNESRVMGMAKTIKDKGFSNSQFEIDDDWETCYGDAIFNKEKFPDPKGTVDALHALGFRVTIWIHPFINNDCESFKYADEKGYFIKNAAGKTALTTWWDSKNDSAGYIDFTNSEAATWWTSRLEKLRNETGLDSYKFDAGEAYWLPKDYALTLDKRYWPNAFTTAYVNTVAIFGNMIEVRTGFKSQRNSTFVRMLDKESVWGDKNGLATLIPSLLHQGILGYPFVLPDMIGGNAYDNVRPSSELFVRWAQANTFMPGVQFSLLPWDFDNKTVNATEMSRDVLKLHEKFSPLIIELAKNATLGLGPIARPTWWLCPTHEDCLLADQQFLLGDDILVTPVVYQGAKSIDVVFPPGTWKQADTGATYEGVAKRTITGITIHSNIYFERV